MKFALRASILSLVVALAATASATLTPPAASPCDARVTVDDPVDCPFCGGNPAVHVRRLVDLQRTNMAIFATLAR
jgi:hypothetical protein